MLTQGAHASGGKDLKTKDESVQKGKTELAWDGNSDLIRQQYPAHILKWLKENPEYVNAKIVFNDVEGSVPTHVIPWFIHLDKMHYGGKWREVIYFILEKAANISPYIPDIVKWFDSMPWTFNPPPAARITKSAIVDLMLKRGVNPHDILNAIKQEESSSLEDIKEQLKEIINLKAAGSETAAATFPDAKTLFEPSDRRIRAIKHAIEDEDLDALAKALGIEEGKSHANKELLEIRDATGYTPFLYAAYLGNREKAMRFLIDAGADTNAQTKDKVGALYFEPKEKKGEYQKLIDEERLARERKQAQLEKDSQEGLKMVSDVIFAVIAKNDPSWMARFALSEAVDIKNNQGRTPLIEAAILGRTEIVEILLVRNADTALTDSEGNTALHRAIAEGHFGIANLLLAKMDKEAVQKKNGNYLTAYELAMKKEARNKDNDEFQKLIKTMKAMQ